MLIVMEHSYPAKMNDALLRHLGYSLLYGILAIHGSAYNATGIACPFGAGIQAFYLRVLKSFAIAGYTHRR
jgi:hypothetical protein